MKNQNQPGCDHQMTAADAQTLQLTAISSRADRIEQLQAIARDRGVDAFAELFADFIGLANGVVEATRVQLGRFLTEQFDESPELAWEANLPCIVGALTGIELAVDPAAPGMCPDCALRRGTPANQCLALLIPAALSVQGRTRQSSALPRPSVRLRRAVALL